MTQSPGKVRKMMDGLLALGILLATALLDYITGYRVTVILLYLAPILFALKRLGLAAAFVMSFLAGAAMLLSDAAAGQTYTDDFIPLWNMTIRIAIFLLVVILAAGRKELESLVRQRTQKLKEEMRENARLEKELLAATEREQERIGHDLHDSLGQHLTATALAGKILSKKLAAKTLPEKEAADHVVRMVEDGIEMTRKLARSLHPVELAGESFVTSLEELAANITIAFNVSCKFDCPQPVPLNDPASNIHIYRIAQEAISNAIRHGHAKNILVRLERTNKIASLTITDDGTGLVETGRAPKGMGLRIMNYRANMIGGTFNIERRPAGGTRVNCTLLLNKMISEDEK
jgi:signal transduction histidine kinase